MAGHFNASSFTSQASFGGGMNQSPVTVVVQHAFGTLYTGSVSLNILKIPPGARLTDIVVTKTNDALTSTDTFASYCGEGGFAFTAGNIVMGTATAGQTTRPGGIAGGVSVTAGQGVIPSPALGRRMTASATLFGHWLASATQISTVNTFRFIVSYLHTETGD